MRMGLISNIFMQTLVTSGPSFDVVKHATQIVGLISLLVGPILFYGHILSFVSRKVKMLWIFQLIWRAIDIYWKPLCVEIVFVERFVFCFSLLVIQPSQVWHTSSLGRNFKVHALESDWIISFRYRVLLSFRNQNYFPLRQSDKYKASLKLHYSKFCTINIFHQTNSILNYC